MPRLRDQKRAKGDTSMLTLESRAVERTSLAARGHQLDQPVVEGLDGGAIAGDGVVESAHLRRGHLALELLAELLRPEGQFLLLLQDGDQPVLPGLDRSGVLEEVAG